MNDQNEFVQKYLEVRDSIIRTALTEIKSLLADEGHESTINDASSLISQGVGFYSTYAGIRFDVFPSDVDWESKKNLPLPRIPFIAFGANLSDRKIEVVVVPICEDGRSLLRVGQKSFGPVGSYNPDEVTKELVYRLVDDFLKKIPFESVVKLRVVD